MLQHSGYQREKAVHGFKAFIVMVESGCVKPYPLVRVGLRLNTFCREECLGRGVHWLSLQDFRYLIKMEICLEAMLPVVISTYGGAWGIALM